MQFCPQCNNMFYLHINEKDESIFHFCRNCGTVDYNNVSTIYDYDTSQVNKFKHINIINKYTKFDPSLPVINTITCPNDSCISNTSSPGERPEPHIKFIKYDDENVKFLYICYHCDKTWTNN